MMSYVLVVALVLVLWSDRCGESMYEVGWSCLVPESRVVGVKRRERRRAL